VTDTTTTETTTTELIDAYFDLWLETDESARAEQLAGVFTADGRHVDPLADASGHDELAAMMANVHAHYPGFAMARTSGIDQHGDQLRFAWRLDAADGTTVVEGLDVAELSHDGRLARVAGFWGELPAR
jgi:SnoaL-like domain